MVFHLLKMIFTGTALICNKTISWYLLTLVLVPNIAVKQVILKISKFICIFSEVSLNKACHSCL